MEEILMAAQLVFYVLASLTMSMFAFLVITLIDAIHKKRRRFRKIWRDSDWREQSTDIR